MRFYKKISLVCLLLCCLFAWAGDSRMTVETASLARDDDHYYLDAQFSPQIAPLLKDAISKGLPLSFLVEFQLVEPRKYWFNDEIYTSSMRINIHYHALTKQYLVSHGKEQKSYETLTEALLAMGEIQHWDVFKASMVEIGKNYQAALLIRLDQSKLPKAIQVDAISSEDWTVASPVHTWAVNLAP